MNLPPIVFSMVKNELPFLHYEVQFQNLTIWPTAVQKHHKLATAWQIAKELKNCLKLCVTKVAFIIAGGCIFLGSLCRVASFIWVTNEFGLGKMCSDDLEWHSLIKQKWQLCVNEYESLAACSVVLYECSTPSR